MFYFNNKSVFLFVLFVLGGLIMDEVVSKIEDYVENELYGDEVNFYKILIIEVEVVEDLMSLFNLGKIWIELVFFMKVM